MKGIQVIELDMHAQKVGRMVQTPDYLCAFEYDLKQAPEFLHFTFS